MRRFLPVEQIILSNKKRKKKSDREKKKVRFCEIKDAEVDDPYLALILFLKLN